MKKSKVPNLVVVAILTVITIVSWIGFDTYRHFAQESKTIVPKTILAPINPELDIQALSELEQSYFIDEDQIQPISINQSDENPDNLEEGESPETEEENLEEEESEASPSGEVDEEPAPESEEISSDE